MTIAKRQVKTQVDANLLTRLQTAVSDASSAAAHDAPESASGPDAERAGNTPGAEGQGTHRPGMQRASWRSVAPRNRVQRSTVSMPLEVAKRARRLTMALTLFEERDVTLGTALGQALDLLEEELHRRGARIPEGDVPMRPGSRHL